MCYMYWSSKPDVVNGEDNNILIHLINSGSKNYTLVSASASYHDPANHWALVSNTAFHSRTVTYFLSTTGQECDHPEVWRPSC